MPLFKASAGADVVVEDHGSTRLILINRPGKRNAINREMYGTIGDAVRDADRDENVKVSGGRGGKVSGILGIIKKTHCF